MQKDEVLSAAAKRNLFLSPDALEIIDSNGCPMEFVNTLLNSLAGNTMFVTKDDVVKFLEGEKALMESQKTIAPKIKRDPDLKIVSGSDITGESTCTGTIEDFANYFRSRYTLLKKIINKRKDFGMSMSIERAKELGRDNMNIVGMVYEKRTTKTGHTILTIEDETDTCAVFISKESPLANEMFVNDEVIGVTGKFTDSKGLFIPETIVKPDVPAGNKWVRLHVVRSVPFGHPYREQGIPEERLGEDDRVAQA